jgi:manganese/zinc/iron transport system permease protein
VDLSVLNDPTLRTVALGTGTLGLVSGSLGTFAVLRRQSLLGDAVSHAALPGVILAYLLTAMKSPPVLVVGAALSGWVATLAVLSVVRNTRIPYDSALAGVLAVFFGVGLMLLDRAVRDKPQGWPLLTRAEVLFGQAATLSPADVGLTAGLGGSALLLLVVFWKQFKLLAFDPDFARSLGLPVRLLDVLLSTLLVVAVVVGLQAVGVVLMSAMLVAPASAARQWSDRLGRVVLLAGLFGSLAGVGGAVASVPLRMPPGPAIVLLASAVVVVSLFVGPARGLLWRLRRGPAPPPAH